jgi:PTH1 family peptidyl-tRNA hydrolase
MLIIGLGNIGDKYKNTRHNIGFMVVDYLINHLNATKISKKEFKGELYKSGDLYLLKPSTYMNLSGESAVVVKNFYKLDKTVAIHDDLDLGFGAVKFKFAGSHGGHNGLKSLDSHIGNEYYRIRVGIGKPNSKDEVVRYVLESFTMQERDFLKDIIQKVATSTLKFESLNLNEISSSDTQKAIDLDEASK